MGMFNRIGTYVNVKLEERKHKIEAENKEKQELEAIRKQALHQERIKAAPTLAAKQVKIEMEQKLKASKEGKTAFGGLNIGGLQNIAHDFGQSSASGFNRDYDLMFGGGSKASKKPSKKQPAPRAFGDVAFGDTSYFGKPPTTHSKLKKKKGRQIIINIPK